jgi:long-subunit fatty acid transport protein
MAAAAYNIPVSFDVDWRTEAAVGSQPATTDAGSSDADYPGRLALGLAYHPRNPLRTTFTLDVARTFWEDLEDSLASIPQIRNAYEFRFGLEHIFYNDLPARIGFFYREAYAMEDVDEAGLSFGAGYRFESFDFGIGADVSKRNSRQDGLAPRNSTDPQIDRVQDSLLRGVIDVRYHF